MFLGSKKPHNSFIVNYVRELLTPYMADLPKNRDRATKILTFITDFEEQAQDIDSAEKAASLIYMICREANVSKIEHKKASVHWSSGISELLLNARSMIQGTKPLESTLMDIVDYLVGMYGAKEDFCESFKTAMQALKNNLKEENNTHKKTLAVDEGELVRSSQILEVFENITNNLMSRQHLAIA